MVERQSAFLTGIEAMISYAGEDPTREGLVETPMRVKRAWDVLFSGYHKDVASLFKTFDLKGYRQIVLLRDIEMYSMCEHHLLPFFGKAHVAYIPDERVIGISKLARIVDHYSHRMQIQERICEQVVDALMKYLAPQAAACIIEADHLCMRMRGVGKQNSTMVTSALRGGFLENAKAREELMSMVKG